MVPQTPKWGQRVTALSLVCIGVGCSIIVILTWIYMLKPATVYGEEPDGSLVNDELLVFIGGFFFLIFFPLAIGE